MFFFGFHLLKELTTMYRDGWQILLAEDQANAQIPKIDWKDNFEASESVALWINADHVGAYLLSLQGSLILNMPAWSWD